MPTQVEYARELIHQALNSPFGILLFAENAQTFLGALYEAKKQLGIENIQFMRWPENPEQNLAIVIGEKQKKASLEALGDLDA